MVAKSNAERQAKLKQERNAKGQFKKSWWVTLKEEAELSRILAELRKDS
jgi:hypothetical protein